MKASHALKFVLILACALVCSVTAVAEELQSYTKRRIQYQEDRRLLLEKKFDVLDRKLNAVQGDYELGKLRSEEVLASLRTFYETSPGFTPLLTEWVTQFPQSYAARSARAVHYKYLGRAQRGGAWINNTSPEQLKGMEHYLKLAMQDLAASEKLTKKPMITYLHMIDIGMYMGKDDFNQKVLKKGLALKSDAFTLRRKYLYTLVPKWGGSFEQMDAFVNGCKEQGVPRNDLHTLEAMVHLEKGLDSVRNKDLLKAMVLFDKAIALNPNIDELHEALWQRIIINTKLKNFTQMIPDLDRVIEMDPESHKAYATRGFAYHHNRNPEKALEDYRNAAELGSGWAQFQLGEFYLRGEIVKQSRNDAIKWYRRAATNGDKNAERKLVDLGLLSAKVMLLPPFALDAL